MQSYVVLKVQTAVLVEEYYEVYVVYRHASTALKNPSDNLMKSWISRSYIATFYTVLLCPILY